MITDFFIRSRSNDRETSMKKGEAEKRYIIIQPAFILFPGNGREKEILFHEARSLPCTDGSSFLLPNCFLPCNE